MLVLPLGFCCCQYWGDKFLNHKWIDKISDHALFYIVLIGVSLFIVFLCFCMSSVGVVGDDTDKEFTVLLIGLILGFILSSRPLVMSTARADARILASVPRGSSCCKQHGSYPGKPGDCSAKAVGCSLSQMIPSFTTRQMPACSVQM